MLRVLECSVVSVIREQTAGALALLSFCGLLHDVPWALGAGIVDVCLGAWHPWLVVL